MIATIFGPAFIWGFGAAAVAVAAEYFYRIMPPPWWHHLHIWTPMQLWIGYCIYRLVTIPGQNLIGAFVVFALCTTAFRLFTSMVLLRESIGPGTWCALGLLLLARVLQSTWK